MNAEPLCPGCGRPLPANAPRGMCPGCLMQGAFATGPDTGGSVRFVAPTVEELAPRFPQFEILAFIGQGGMGAVYQARQKQLDRIVALKILPPGIGPDAAFAERFGREARALARLNHPGIVTIHDFGQADGLYYLVMEYVDGVTLRQLLHGGRISAREALAIVPQICDALQFAHDQGIVHRDIKPENILLDRRGRVKVADFGLAKIMDHTGRADLPVSPNIGSAPSEAPSGIMGTPNYMAPEQMDHPGEVDHRADIYALGVVFYQMLTGELPTGKFDPPSKKVHIDVRLDEIVLRALEKKPELRYQQASDVKTCVETIIATPDTDLGSSRREEAQTQSGKRESSFAKATADMSGKAETEAPSQRLPTLSPATAFNPREQILVIGVTLFLAVMFFVTLGVALAYPRQAAAPLMVMGMCVFGLVITGLCLAGLWPISSGRFPKPNFSSRNLPPPANPDLRSSRREEAQTESGKLKIGKAETEGPITPGSTSNNFVAVLRWRDRWLWDTGNVTLMAFVPGMVSLVLTVSLFPFLGALSLLLLLPGVLGLLFAATYAVVGNRVRKLKANLSQPDTDAEVAEALFFRRPWQTPGLAVLHADRLVLLGIALMDRLVIPLADIAAISEVRWFNGKRLWWKCGFVLDLKNGQRVGVAVAEPFARRWRARLSGGTLPELSETEGQNQRPPALPSTRAKPRFSVLAIAAVAAGIGGLLVLILALPFMIVDVHHLGGDSILAGQPDKMKTSPLTDVIKAALAAPDNPLPWQELESRLQAGRFSAPEANQFVREVTAWLEWSYAHGFNQNPSNIGNKFGTLVEDLDARHLVAETNALAFMDVYGGRPALEPVPRVRAKDATLRVNYLSGHLWQNGWFGVYLLQDARAFTIDGRPVKVGEVLGRDLYGQPGCNCELILPPLAPGQHVLSGEFVRDWINPADLPGLPANAPPNDWPPARHRTVTSVAEPFTVYPAEAALVRAVVDPALDPVTADHVAIERVVIRPKGGGLTAIVSFVPLTNVAAPISVAVTLRLGAQTVTCGNWLVVSNLGYLGALVVDLRSLDPKVNKADVIMTPDPKAAEPYPQIDRIWGEAIVFSNVPLTRLDLSGPGPAQTNYIPANATAAPVSPSARFEFRWVAADAETNLPADLLADPQDQTGQSFLRVLKPVVLDSSDVANASLTQDQPDQKTLLVHLTEPGSQKMASASAQGVGRRLAVVWNGRVLSAPYINSPIPGPDMNITGSFRNGEEQPLLDVLNHRHPSP